jgi:hypothetical protein
VELGTDCAGITKPPLYFVIPDEHCKTRNPGATAEE